MTENRRGNDKKETGMTIKEDLKITNHYRDILHNLDRNNPEHRKIYEKVRFDFLAMNEGERHTAYKDHLGNTTIGVGFNMSTAGARKEFNKAFDSKINFDDAKNGKIKLTDEQVKKLFDQSMKSRERYLRSSYNEVYDKLKYNELLAIEDLNFNGPKLVKNGSKFHEYMNNYYQTRDAKYLHLATCELVNRSNPQKHLGIQNRRLKQAAMLDSRLCPFYSGPHSTLLPFEHIKAKLNETVIPRCTEYWKKDPNSEYYIWRTMMDDKVRTSHLQFEGKIFKKNTLPPGIENVMYNCRCWQEVLPINIHIINESIARQYNKYMLVNYPRNPLGLEFKMACIKVTSYTRL
ncbi:MAG: hypothetical protein SFT93_04385 [Rickettsiaceae bacterium]|nr:hypothetical protein [Rickettsiaceae bacterium]